MDHRMADEIEGIIRYTTRSSRDIATQFGIPVEEVMAMKQRLVRPQITRGPLMNMTELESYVQRYLAIRAAERRLCVWSPPLVLEETALHAFVAWVAGEEQRVRQEEGP